MATHGIFMVMSTHPALTERDSAAGRLSGDSEIWVSSFPRCCWGSLKNNIARKGNVSIIYQSCGQCLIATLSRGGNKEIAM